MNKLSLRDREENKTPRNNRQERSRPWPELPKTESEKENSLMSTSENSTEKSRRLGKASTRWSTRCTHQILPRKSIKCSMRHSEPHTKELRKSMKRDKVNTITSGNSMNKTINSRCKWKKRHAKLKKHTKSKSDKTLSNLLMTKQDLRN